MNYTNIDVLTLKTIRDTIQTYLTNLVKRLDLELEQGAQIEGDKEDQKTCWEEISSLMWDIKPLMQLTYEQLKSWLQPIEFECIQLLPIFWRTN